MTILLSERKAFGHPGIAPRWTRSAKDAVGTAYADSSRVWFTVARGILNEVYFPTVDRPQIRDLQYLITDGTTFFHDERRHLTSRVEYLAPHGLACNHEPDPDGRYQLHKQIITDPHQPCVLIHTQLETLTTFARKLRMFALLAPHLEGGGASNSGYVAVRAGRETLVAKRAGRGWRSARRFRSSAGHVVTSVGSDGSATDLAENYQLDSEFDAVAEDGNIGFSLTGELDLTEGHEFVLGLAFGETLHHAVTTLSQSLGFSFANHRQRFVEQWARAGRSLAPLADVSEDGGRLYRES